MSAATAAMVMLSGCSASHTSTTDSGAGSADATAIPKGAFGHSACARCVTSSCSAALSDCASDPDCAAYWSCVERCGVGSNGDVDRSCEAACPRGAISSGAQAELELAHCRSEGTGALCAPCGTSATADLSPLLKQQCSGKASPDASACDRCIAQDCCDTHVACGTQCSDYIDCLGQNQTFEVCKAKYPSGFLPGEQDRACISVRCYTTGLCVGVQDPFLQCIFQECGNEYATLAGTEDGASYAVCVILKYDAPQCLALYPAVNGKQADALNTCITSACQSSVAGN